MAGVQSPVQGGIGLPERQRLVRFPRLLEIHARDHLRKRWPTQSMAL